MDEDVTSIHITEVLSSLKIIDLGRVGKIAKIIPCPSKEEFVKNYREAFPDLCSQPKKSFGREIFINLVSSNYKNIVSLQLDSFQFLEI